MDPVAEVFKPADVEAKVLEYERYINDVLKRDLQKTLQQLDTIHMECIEYMNTKAVIDSVIENGIGSNLKTKYDLGCNFYVTAKIPDTSMVFVRIGLGIYLEYTLPEATEFIQGQIEKLESGAKELDEKIVKIRAFIKLTLEALRELQGISADPEKERREFVL
ncbi:protein UXT-like [Symsagittifera roscoffensis]|uniref:protein UXT-like n=1 Tax=Symsagittifera roscoffensis TaxID=84072 RepID=UPI00307BA71A